jgi:hypothetical protein
MSITDITAIRRQGANARALGVDYFSNPYSASDKVPGFTGEDVSTWASKLGAWWQGWEIEDSLRSMGVKP